MRRPRVIVLDYSRSMAGQFELACQRLAPIMDHPRDYPVKRVVNALSWFWVTSNALDSLTPHTRKTNGKLETERLVDLLETGLLKDGFITTEMLFYIHAGGLL